MASPASQHLGQLLVSLQLSDSAFPSGFYTLSHGLEGFRQAGLVSPNDVEGLLADLLVHSVGPGDATALALAHRGVLAGDWGLVVAADQRLFASKLNAEMRRAAVRCGHQIADLTAEVVGGQELAEYCRLIRARLTPGCQAVATGVAYASAGVDTAEAVASDMFAFAASFVGAALRLRLTDHRQAQVALHAVGPVIAEAAQAAVGRDIEDLGGCVPMADVVSARHERAEARLFAS